jgi:hypothetical protein
VRTLRHPVQAAPKGSLASRLLGAELIIIVLTQTLAVPLGRDAQIPLALLIHAAFVVLWFARGITRLSIPNVALFAAVTFCAFAVHIRHPHGTYSLSSLGLFLLISSFYVVSVPLTRSAYQNLMSVWAAMGMIASVAVVVNWSTQLLGLGMPSLVHVLPDPLIYRGFVHTQPVEWGSAWTKPNGFIFLETSHLSQFIALALVVEGVFFRRIPRMLFMGGALIATLAGTGMLLVLMAAPFLLVRLRPGLIVLGMILLPLVVALAMQFGLLEHFVARLLEFSQTGTSGYNRFVLPFTALIDTWRYGDTPEAWFGIGAGNIPAGSNLAFNAYSKVSVEYGAVVLIAWLALLLSAHFGGGTPLVVGWIAFIQLQLLNGALNVPLHHVYCLLLAAGIGIVFTTRSSRFDR